MFLIIFILNLNITTNSGSASFGTIPIYARGGILKKTKKILSAYA